MSYGRMLEREVELGQRVFELLAQAKDIETWAGLSASVGSSKIRGEGSHEEEDHPCVFPDCSVECGGKPRFHFLTETVGF